MNPVRPITWKGWALVTLVRTLYRLLNLLGYRHGPYPEPNQHEDPGSMRDRWHETRSGIYLGSKYYHRPLVLDEKGSGIREALHTPHGPDPLPLGFQTEHRMTLHAGGDLIPYQAIHPLVCKHLWDEIGGDFFGADLVVANLESPAYFQRPYLPAPEVMLSDMLFNIDRATWDLFNGSGRWRGLDLVSVANNHSLDQGMDGLEATLDFLRSQQVAYAGASRSGSDEESAPVLDRNGIRLGFVGATFSLNKGVIPPGFEAYCQVVRMNEPNADWTSLVRQVHGTRQRGADLVVALLHGGGAYQAFPGSVFRNNVHRFCDESGVDLVIAGHPHHPQPVEKYHSKVSGRNHWIVYSLGDFVAYDIFKWSHITAWLRVEILKGSYPDQASPNGQSEATCIHRLELTPVYVEAIMREQRVEFLRFKRIHDKNGVKSIDSLDEASQVEFKEVREFWDRWVQPSLTEWSSNSFRD